MSQENVRVRRTRTLLRQALVELIEERGFDRITVGQITERAMVSRAAFYRNYRDKYQLVEQIFEEALAELLGTVADGPDTPVLERWTGFFEHFDRYHRLYGALLGGNGSSWFAARMRSALADMAAEHLPQAPGDLIPTLLAGMHLQAITWWLGTGRSIPAREIAVRTAKLASALITEANAHEGVARISD
ncbi:TetR/AcrR family transcriptional regulator [Actinoallomurus sp. NPDC052308]|uniref:TetR/AcrR family transcriptional regulator n=1 Tax=Actinoallomurus sp. NPDC052308 TaxID=3155530 RepID=UPI00343165DA